MIYRVLVGVDGTEASKTALEIACALADNYEAALGLLSVLEPHEISDELLRAAEVEGVVREATTYSQVIDSGFGASLASDDYREMERGELAARVARTVAESIVEQAKAYSATKPFKAIKTFVRSGDPAKAILDVAKENAADIIIMGHDQQGRVESLFKGSVAEKVQRDADCPVLIYCLPKSS